MNKYNDKYRCRQSLGRRLAMAAAVATVITPSTPLMAQESLSLEEVVITARRRAEDLQSTPVAVQAFSADAIEQRSIQNIEDMGQLVPNVAITPDAQAGSGAVNIVIRGIGQQDFRIFTDPAVTLYVDGVLIPRSLGGLLNVIDVERAEVLKGPQGTLFGKNTVAGAINLVSAKPDDTFGGNIDVTLGEDQRRNLGVTLNAPITDNLLSKVSITTRNSDGWGSAQPFATESGQVPSGAQRNDEDLQAARLQLLWTQDSFEALWAFDSSRSRSNGSARHPFEPLEIYSAGSPRNLVAAYNTVVQSAGADLPLSNSGLIPGDVYTSGSKFEEKANMDVWGTALTLNWDWDALSFKSISSYRQLDNEIAIDFDATQVRIFDQAEKNEQDQIGQEFQLSGIGFDDRLNWVAGLFYFKESGTRDVTSTRLGDLVALNLQPATNRRNFVTMLDVESYAAFAQGTFQFNDLFSVTTGVRWSAEEKTLSGRETRAAGFDSAFVNAVGKGSDDWSSVTPRLSFEFQLSEDLMTYVSAAKGFKSGGFNGRLNSSLPNGGILPYDPEEVWTYEWGVRSELFDHRLRINATAFFNDYTDIQTETTLLIDGNVVNTVSNAAAAEIKGVEVELTAQLTESFVLDASVGYLDAEYTDISEARQLDSDSVFPRTPEWSATLGAQHEINLNSGAIIVSRLDVTYQDETYSELNPADLQRDVLLDSYTLANLRVDYVVEDDWKLSLFVKNLTDKEYKTSALFNSGLGGGYELYGTPRQAGISAKKYF
jgi:iron complex outermembrane recepter protein